MNENQLIEKWVSDQLTEEERKAFNALDDAPFYKAIIDDASCFKASNFSEMPDFETFKARIAADKTPVRTIQWIKPLLRIASVLIVGFGVYILFFATSLTEVGTRVVEKTSVELPDGSRVVLNALSEVKYNEKEWDSNRSVELQGEAFFDVEKGARFNVVTTKGTVIVLGTEFNVKQRGTIFEVACFEGTVKVVTQEGTEILKVGDSYQSIDGRVTTAKTTFDGPQWINNMSQFHRLPVSEVMAELERQYGITIQAENIDPDQLFTGGFVHGNLESALNSISEPLGLKHEIIKPGKVRLSMSD